MLVELKCTEREELSADITLRFAQLNFFILLLMTVLSAVLLKKMLCLMEGANRKQELIAAGLR